jgi:tetratricopeptide (TPR) repeat protein
MRVYILVPVLLLVSQVTGLNQSSERPGGKPVLIRDEVQKRLEKDEQKVYPHDPEQARKNLEIGSFYQKRGNLKAAEERYREAINFNLPWAEPYERLIAMLAKAGRREDAVAVCDLFLSNNPTSPRREDFEKRKAELNARLAGTTP